MADRRLRTKRSVERDKGGTRNTRAQTSRQEALAVELARRAFASPNARLWDDVPDRDGGRYKDAWYDQEMLQRQNVNSMWPYPQSKFSDRNTEWGDSRGRMISQDLEAEMASTWRDWDGKGRQPSAMSSGASVSPTQWGTQKWQPDVPSDYNNVQAQGLYAALGRLFGR